ncbi:MAG TPA: TIGR00159 family protein, partial [Firmicutes bacterium]|nr:TIGR00159 family protein [Bacillota bacterium]
KPLLKGLGIVFAFSVVTKRLNLVMLGGLLQYLLGVMVIALPVLFQPELRRVLEELGKNDFFARFFAISPRENYDVVKIIAETAEEMARENKGALIILEREIPLREVAESGQLIDAEVSVVLLKQLFFKDTPLHDGAVIIRGDRITAASCILPLSTRVDLPLSYGTRHRAGVGMSEQSDAIVVIVSEERGKITVVNNGEIRECSKQGELLDYLWAEFAEKNKERITIPKDIFYRKMDS